MLNSTINRGLLLFLSALPFYTVSLFVEDVLLEKYCFVFASFIALILIFSKKIILRVDVAFIAASTLLLFFLIYDKFRTVNLFCLTGFIIFLFYFRRNRSNVFFETCLIVFALIQALYGIYAFVKGQGSWARGSFDNPAGFAAYLSAVLPLCFKIKNRYLRLLLVCIIAGAVVLSQSRAGIIVVVLSVSVTACFRFKDFINRHKRYIPLTASALVVCFAASIFFIKKDSASGRVLIWQVTSTMIKENPFMGKGTGAFSKNYMVYQADYFKNNPDSKYASLADNVVHPFNEFLLLTAEYGLTGLIVVCLGLVLIVRYSRKRFSLFSLVLLSVAVFSLFSYPLRYPIIWLICAYCIANLAHGSKAVFTKRIGKSRYILLACACVYAVGALIVVKDIKYEYKWRKMSDTQITNDVLNDYEVLYAKWNKNPLFLYNYGAVLNSKQMYVKSNDVLKKCELYFNDYDVQMLLANNCKNIEDYVMAEHYYTTASNMCPNRFMPLFRLAEMYIGQGRNEEAYTIALKIVNKEVKIPSQAVFSIKQKMKKYVHSYN